MPAMQQVANWLNKLGMSEYAERFAENDIDMAVLPDLTDQHLKDLGVSLGHRLKMLRAIRDLSGAPVAFTAPSAPVATQPTQRDEAERRQLTVMFCDLVGSTALAARLDPEDLRGIIGAYHRCCAEWIERNGGFVAKYMGDGVLAYFGYPKAHEHDAERAVRAGLGLVEGIPKLSTSAGLPLQVRIGIATGLVVVGDLIGAGAAQEQAVVGKTPNLAARLQGLAEPGAVVIASSTRRLIGGLFEYRDLGAVPLKGFDEDVPAWQVLGAGAAESRFEALRATTTPLIGRDEEIDLLMRRWEQVKRGEGCVVLISGEPGIGKSRIAQTIVERLSAEPYTRLRYFCSPHHQDSALYPSIAQLERAAGFRREDTADQRLEKLEAVLAQGTNDLSEAVPLLADLLSIPTGDRYSPLNLTPQKRKEKTLRAQLAQVEGLAAHQPVLMVFEDVHWSDPTTRESLDLLIDLVPELRVLVILTFRPEFVPPWVGRPYVTMLTLTRLTPRQRAEMIDRLTGGKALPKEIADQIVDRTDGVPLFIEELTKSILEGGLLAEAEDQYIATGPVAPLAVPTTLHASLMARLDRLAPTREIAQIGAALGRQFSHELISAIAQMPQPQVDDALAQLVHAELIFRRGMPPDAEYTFKHALVQDAAYETLLRSRRQELHSRIVAVLEKQFPEIVEVHPDHVARHCTEAGSIGKAIGYYLLGGKQSTSRWAMLEAVAQLRKGLELVPDMADGSARAELELDLQMTIGYALLTTKGYAATEPGEAYTRARQLCDQLNRPAQLGAILVGQFVFHLTRGDLDEAKRIADEIRLLGEGQNEPFPKFVGSVVCGNVCCWRGKPIDAVGHYRKALELWDPIYRRLAPAPEDPYVLIQLMLSRTLLYLGHIDQARLRRDQGLAEARQLSPFTLAMALQLAWFVDWPMEGIRSASTLLRAADEMIGISTEHGFPLWLGAAKIMRGCCLSATEGIPLIVEGLAISSATGCKLMRPFYLTGFAEVYSRAGQPKEGLNQLAAAVEIMGMTQERWAEAETHRLRGILLLSMRDDAAAEDAYRKALAAARQQNARFWELRAALDLARLWRDQGKRAEARDLLAPIYGWFTEGFDTPVLQDAKALLDQLT
jgi:class 3 adenylate cyclase/predicted ATPase